MDTTIKLRITKSFFLMLILPFLFFVEGCGQGRHSVNKQVNPSDMDSVTMKEKTSTIGKNLTKLWETPAVFKTPESVCYDRQRNQFYVSNINGNPSEKDSNGFISIMNTDGTVKTLQWITGLNAPKGLGIYGNDLYVADIDQVVRIDIEKGLILNKYQAPGATFLNDIALDGNGVVYVSDTDTHRVYMLKNDHVEPYLDSDKLSGANGLFVENGSLLIGTKEAMYKVTLGDKNPIPYIEHTGSIDGLEATGDGRYLISDWQGHVYLSEPGKSPELLLDTTPAKINAADIDYIGTMRLLLIPTFFDNRVMAYEVVL
jgi:hypothetical protein